MKGENPNEVYDNLSQDYCAILIQKLVDLGVSRERLEKYTWNQLETMLEIELGKRIRMAYDGEICKNCGLVWHRKFAYDNCPRCSNKKKE